MNAVYYGSHRYQDGTWLPAQECPVDRATGRLLGFICLNAHGIYPTTGVQKRPRTYYLANDITSSRGRVWASKECVVLAHPGDDLTDGKVWLQQHNVLYFQCFTFDFRCTGNALVFQSCICQLVRKTCKAFQKGATCPHAEVG